MELDRLPPAHTIARSFVATVNLPQIRPLKIGVFSLKAHAVPHSLVTPSSGAFGRAGTATAGVATGEGQRHAKQRREQQPAGSALCCNTTHQEQRAPTPAAAANRRRCRCHCRRQHGELAVGAASGSDANQVVSSDGAPSQVEAPIVSLSIERTRDAVAGSRRMPRHWKIHGESVNERSRDE